MVEGKHTIGLNETQLGIAAPKWFRDVYSSTMGHRQAELALLRYIYLINMYEIYLINILRDEILHDVTVTFQRNFI